MWAKLKSFKIKKDGKVSKDASKSLDVNEEYISALRTNSYAEFFSKAQSALLTQTSYCHHKISEILLEPDQDTIPCILESAILSKIPEIKTLMHKYFDISAEASNICSHLLKNITQMHSSYKFVQCALDTIDDYYYSPEKAHFIMLQLTSFAHSKNPLSDTNNNDFKLIHDKYLSVLNHLRTKRKRVARKLKLIKFFKKGFGVCLTAACGLVAIAAIVVAIHTLAAILVGPAIFGFFPFKVLRRLKFPRNGILGRIWEQLDVATKGVYILNRDFDTMSRLVARLHDEVEHNKIMIQFCVERKEDRFCLELVKELKKSSVWVRNQVEELEEHVYLCLVTINRARTLVVKEMTASCFDDSRL